MSESNLKLQALFSEKKYSEIIDIIENGTTTLTRSAGLLNLLGACKLLRANKENNNLISANINFRESYLKEKKTDQGLNGLINFINTTAEIFDQEIITIKQNLVIKLIEETTLYFEEANIFFGFNEKLIRSIIRIYKRQNNVQKVLFFLEKLIDNNCTDPQILCSFIYRNCFVEKWSQKDFLYYSRLLNKNLTKYPEEKLLKINQSKDKKIHIGFLTSDIKSNHSITYFLKTVLQNYNTNNFHLTLILNLKNHDSTTEFFKTMVDESIDISDLKDVEAINVIRKNNIDIVIDLMGVTSTNRMALFKNKLAPIQVSWLGYCNTSGLEQMDYILADPNVIKNTEIDLYSETIIVLPNIWNCHSGLEIERIKNLPPSLKKNYITFGSFNNFNKINENVVKVWSTILKNTTNSKLILKSSISMQETIIQDMFKKYGVFNSVIFEKKKTFNEHLKLYNSIDIALDTFPYNGVTTSFESIYMGVPVLTMKGYNFNSRCGESINKNLKMNYLISKDQDDYVFKAKELSENSEKLISIRNEIYDKALSSPLFNTKNFSKVFYEQMTQIHNKNVTF